MLWKNCQSINDWIINHYQKLCNKIKEFCLNSDNLLHVIIISNMLMDIMKDKADKYIDEFLLINQTAKFYLLVLCNIKITNNITEVFTLKSKICIYELLADQQIECYSDYIRNSSILNPLLKKNIKFDLDLDSKYKDFSEYLQSIGETDIVKSHAEQNSLQISS